MSGKSTRRLGATLCAFLIGLVVFTAAPAFASLAERLLKDDPTIGELREMCVRDGASFSVHPYMIVFSDGTHYNTGLAHLRCVTSDLAADLILGPAPAGAATSMVIVVGYDSEGVVGMFHVEQDAEGWLISDNIDVVNGHHLEVDPIWEQLENRLFHYDPPFLVGVRFTLKDRKGGAVLLESEIRCAPAPCKKVEHPSH